MIDRDLQSNVKPPHFSLFVFETIKNFLTTRQLNVESL